MKNTTCCFSGHRNLNYVETFEIKLKLKKELSKLINNGYDRFLCGGALGFDTICALSVLKAKEKNHQIKLILVLPCQNQTKYWSNKDKQIYEKIKSKSDEIIYTSQIYYKGCMQKRNRYMIDHSSYCIYYLKKSSGGTFNTINYAKNHKLQLKNVAE